MNDKLPEKLTRPYNPKETEDRIYKLWEDSGFFNPDVCIEKGVTKADAEHFSISLPPPNVTGNLHTGHALMLVIQDIMVRQARMRGLKTLWVPGTDHAPIATESKVAKLIEKDEGKRKQDFTREEFIKKVEKFAQESHDTIVNQCKKMGASLDWSREAFTFDDKRNVAVKTAFKKMYDDGLIYRGLRVINWDPKGQTTISDDEIVYVARKTKLFTFKYSHDFPIAISSTQPETKLGDTAVAVHPDDTRYKEFVGKTFDVDLMGEKLKIKVVADQAVDPAFGTGALGVTPAHSKIDAEIAERHNLPMKQVINEFAKMTVVNPLLNNKKTVEAREIVAQYFRDQKLMIEEKEIDQNVPTAERTGGIIEALPKLQWFIDVNKKIPSRGNKSLKELMLEPVREGKIKILPDHFEKVYFNWIENLRDWCISRQIWYGHRIPVWYKGDEIFVGMEKPVEDGPAKDGASWIQDEDTLDTWFSSGLWTFSTLGWPEKTKDLATYHPTSVLETGHDILFFWIARMILMSQYLLGEVPFENVYLHGMVRTADGKKMSKSLGEKAIDPLDIIAKYGNDALRMAMVIGNTPGNDLKLNENDIRGYGKFTNKVWNASRFVLEQTQDLDIKNLPKLDEEDTKSADELEALLSEVSKEMSQFRFSIVAEKLYHYFWHTFADVIIERSKNKILDKDFNKIEGKSADSAKALLYSQLTTLLKALHPFMPFVTEEIWSMMPQDNKNLLMVEKWPNNAK
ncbi:MAG: valine--tRNA ligase [bacterium]